MIRSSRADALRLRANRSSSLRQAALASAVLTVLGGGTVASATSLTWDNTGGLQTPDWQLGTIPSSAGIWDPTNAAGNPGGAPTHWAGSTDVGAGNTGVLTGTSDPTNAYFIEIPNAGVGNASGFSVTQGSYIMPGFGNGGLGHGSAPSYVNVGSGTFNIDVASGASLALGYTQNLLSFEGSATIVKTDSGFLNDVMNLRVQQIGTGTFTGKWDIEGGSFGLFYGGNTMLGEPSSFVADQLKIDNNAVIDMFQNSTAVQISNQSGQGFQGITIGSGGATFFGRGAYALDGLTGNIQMGAIVFNSKVTGGSAASPVTITWASNVTDASVSSGQGFSQGCAGDLYTDNHTSLFAKWIVNGGEIVPNDTKTDLGLTGNNDFGLGAVPTAYLADAITLDRQTTGTSPTDVSGNSWQSNVLAGGANIRVDKFGGLTIPANRGIHLGPGGGGLHPADNSNAAHNQLTIASIISGPGQLRVMLDSSLAVVILNGADTYTGGTWITAAAGGTPQSNAYLQVTTASLPAHQSGFTNTGTITDGQYTLPNSDVINDGTLIFDQTFDGTYGGTISTSSVTSNIPSGSNNYTPLGNLTKNSAGIVLFTGNNTYIGTTTINGGAFVADSTASLPNYSAGGGKVVVNSGAALAVTSTNWSSGNISAVESSATFNSGSYFGFNVPTANAYTYVTTSHPANAGIFKTGGGDLTITGNSTGNGSLWINAGKVIMSSSGATLGNAPGPITINSGTLDITNNRLITTNAVGTFNAGSYTAGSITRWIHDGVLTSSTAAGQGGLTGVAVSTGANVKGLSGTQTATWAGYTVHATDTLIMYTYAGDDTLDGAINGDDYARIDAGFAGRLTGYDNGDFNLDGKINADDYFIIDSNYGRQTLGFTAPAPPLAGVSAVPEPASLALLAAATGGLLLRRRRGLRALSY